jgi:hypothetical protein
MLTDSRGPAIAVNDHRAGQLRSANTADQAPGAGAGVYAVAARHGATDDGRGVSAGALDESLSTGGQVVSHPRRE